MPTLTEVMPISYNNISGGFLLLATEGFLNNNLCLQLLVKKYEKINLLYPLEFVITKYFVVTNKTKCYWLIATKVYFSLLLYMSWVSLWVYSSCDPDQRNNSYLGYTILMAEGRTITELWNNSKASAIHGTQRFFSYSIG